MAGRTDVLPVGQATKRARGFLTPVDYSDRRRYRRPPPAYTRLQWLGWGLTRMGLSPAFVTLLEVPGRRSGRTRRVNLVVTTYRGARYLVSLSGEAEWVRNVRAAGGHVTVGRRHRRPAVLHEVPPEARVPIIKTYIGREGHSSAQAAARTARYYFGVNAGASDLELRRIADYYPIFRIEERMMDGIDVSGTVKDVARVERVFGEPITQDGVTVIPVARIGGGGGSGTGKQEGERPGEGSGGGFGLGATPAGVFVIKDGDARWRPAIDINKIIIGGQTVAVVALLTVRAIVRMRIGKGSRKRR
ncbi:hypothetical protein GCM10022419_046740 [Nonomuraea rosea]|uniref:Nitroreductase family deazaflavin-dependent oxidoreductase n=1 Tax=Nonomuraea rosea TaxID=638574 RepID=A0ABP6X3P1_9ACTN